MNIMNRRLPEKIGLWIITVVLSLSNFYSPAAEPQFDRLFTTREQRQRLQELRERNRQIARDRDHTGAETHGMKQNFRTDQTRTALLRPLEGSSEERPVITLRGLIYRKDRAGMAWINARDGAAGLDYRKLDSGQLLDNEVTIRVPETGKSVKLKPGQSYHLHSGAITELKEDVR